MKSDITYSVNTVRLSEWRQLYIGKTVNFHGRVLRSSIRRLHSNAFIFYMY